MHQEPGRPRDEAAQPDPVQIGDGAGYRVVGTVKGNFTTFHPEAEDPEDAIGFFKVNLNVIGPGGLLGKVKFSERAKRNGDEVVRAKGNCDFVGDDEE